MITKIFRHTATALLLSLSCTTSFADVFPDKPIRLVVAYAPGGASDEFGRLIASGMGNALGSTVVVENRAGANGYIGTQAVKAAKPDGYTLLLVAPFYTVAPQMDPQANFTMDDFTSIASVVEAPPNAFVVPGTLPVSTLQEFVDYAKAQPEKLYVAQTGVGGTNHLGLEAFMHSTGVEMTFVPYKGTSPMLPDLVSGRIHFALPPSNAVEGLVTTGKLKALAVNGLSRYVGLPDVPTVQEAGMSPAIVALPWYGIVAPKGTPDDIVAKLNGAINTALQSSDIKEKLKAKGATVTGGSPEDFQKFLEADAKQWGQLVKERNLVQQP
jgi:tripartite-type tricarboxylate transporter receptor subunit TctC